MRKPIALVLSLFLVFSLLAGCGTSPQTKADTPLQQAPTAIQSPATPSSDTGKEAPASTETAKETASPAPEKPAESPKEPAEQKPSGQLRVHFIDVGQGDSIFIQAPSQNVLIDGGERGTTVVNYLKNQGVKSLDIVIGTHPHADHIGGLINVIESFPVKEVIDPGVVHTTKTFEDYLTLIDKKDIKFTEGRAGMSRDLGNGARMDILHPVSPSSSHLNDASIVVRLTFGRVSFLFTGDAEKASEEQMLKRKENLKSTVLKVGHHGSRTSTTAAFLSAVNPEVAVIMCGKDNKYGHPHDDTLKKLADAKVDVYRTDIHGTIVIITNGQTYEINQKQPYQYLPPKVPEPAPATAPAPPPAPAPSPDAKLAVVSYTETVAQGGTASITIQGKPNTHYSITVTHKSGPSKASGLEAKTSGPDGKVTWAWTVGARTTPGSWPIDIKGGGESIRVHFAVK